MKIFPNITALFVLLVACAPTTSEVASEPYVPKPTILETPVGSVGTITATLNNRPVELASSGDGQLFVTADFIGGVGLSPKTFESVENSTFQVYADRYLLDAGELLLSLTYNQPSGFEFSLVNVTDEPIRVVWDDSAIILPDGTSSRLIHLGVNYSEMNSSQPSTIIPPGAGIDEYAGPTSRIDVVASEWREYPLFLSVEPGKKATLYLALDVGNERQNLAFTFTATATHEILR